MNRLIVSVMFIGGFLLVLVAWFLWPLDGGSSQRRVAAKVLAVVERAGLPTLKSAPPRPEKFFGFTHEPNTKEERAIADWWTYMNEKDIGFRWKAPINFYGRVVNQRDEPVAGANVHFSWNDVSGSHFKDVVSGPDGRFELLREHGKVLDVLIGARGHQGYRSSHQNFEFSDYWDPSFYDSDKENPAAFRLWKFEGAVPLRFVRRLKGLEVDGTKVWFDIKTGKFGDSGDIAFSTKRGLTHETDYFDWSMNVEAAEGAGLLEGEEELMFEAPESGYRQSWSFDVSGGNPRGRIDKQVRFYVRSAAGLYAVLSVDLAHSRVPKGSVSVVAYINPTGSRNLQYDSDLRIEER